MIFAFNRKAGVVLATVLLLGGYAQMSSAAQASTTMSRDVLQHLNYPAGYEVSVIRITLPANFNVPHHTHPGLESGYVARGSATLVVDGQPDRLLHAGDTFETPANVGHQVKNGPAETELISTYVTEAGKPLTHMLPQ